VPDNPGSYMDQITPREGDGLLVRRTSVPHTPSLGESPVITPRAISPSLDSQDLMSLFSNPEESEEAQLRSMIANCKITLRFNNGDFSFLK
jgi:hypothetical protein